jgi:hypothetical protein
LIRDGLYAERVEILVIGRHGLITDGFLAGGCHRHYGHGLITSKIVVVTVGTADSNSRRDGKKDTQKMQNSEKIPTEGVEYQQGELAGYSLRVYCTSLQYPKDHWIDAACVGESGREVFIPKTITPLIITAKGRGSRQKCSMNT